MLIIAAKDPSGEGPSPGFQRKKKRKASPLEKEAKEAVRNLLFGDPTGKPKPENKRSGGRPIIAFIKKSLTADGWVEQRPGVYAKDAQYTKHIVRFAWGTKEIHGRQVTGVHFKHTYGEDGTKWLGTGQNGVSNEKGVKAYLSSVKRKIGEVERKEARKGKK